MIDGVSNSIDKHMPKEPGTAADLALCLSRACRQIRDAHDRSIWFESISAGHLLHDARDVDATVLLADGSSLECAGKLE